MKLGIVLSNDWELFGDGSGDYFEVQHRPLAEMLAVCDDFGAKLTLMAEIGQQWAHEQLAAIYPWASEVCAAWREALRETVRRGSDVQLHLHPQWLDAHWTAGRWHLNLDKWATGQLSYKELVTTLKRGKDDLQSLLRPSRSSYECVAFRAGAYCVEPSANVIAALRKVGICCETSVTKGCVSEGEYDYRDAHSHVLPWWIGTESVKFAGAAADLMELPIASVRLLESPLLRRATGFRYTRWPSSEERLWQAKRDRVLAARYPVSRRATNLKHTGRRTPVMRARGALLRHSPVQLDYDVLPASVFVDLVERLAADKTVATWYEARRRKLGYEFPLPIVTSGHTKTMHDCGNLTRILKLLRQRFGQRLVFLTMQEAVDLLQTVMSSAHSFEPRAVVNGKSAA